MAVRPGRTSVSRSLNASWVDRLIDGRETHSYAYQPLTLPHPLCFQTPPNARTSSSGWRRTTWRRGSTPRSSSVATAAVAAASRLPPLPPLLYLHPRRPRPHRCPRPWHSQRRPHRSRPSPRPRPRHPAARPCLPRQQPPSATFRPWTASCSRVGAGSVVLPWTPARGRLRCVPYPHCMGPV